MEHLNLVFLIPVVYKIHVKICCDGIVKFYFLCIVKFRKYYYNWTSFICQLDWTLSDIVEWKGCMGSFCLHNSFSKLDDGLYIVNWYFSSSIWSKEWICRPNCLLGAFRAKGDELVVKRKLLNKFCTLLLKNTAQLLLLEIPLAWRQILVALNVEINFGS